MDLRVLATEQDGVVTTAQLRACGVTRAVERGHLRAGRWMRLRRGVVLVEPSRARTDPVAVAARSAALSCPRGVLAGRTAGRLWGFDGVPDGPDEVLVDPDHALRPRPDLVAHRTALVAAEVRMVRGMRVTSPGRTLLDLVVESDRPTALALLDSSLRRRLVGADRLPSLALAAAARSGGAVVRDLWLLADPRSESVLESRVRLRCLDAGLAPDELQLEVRDEHGAVLARADMAFRLPGGNGWLLVEADGAAVHGSADAAFRDRRRANALAALGYLVLRFTWRDTLDPFTIPRAIRAALRQAA